MNKKITIYLLIPVILIALILVILKTRSKSGISEVVEELNPVVGSIQTIISTTGTVLPKNRLEIKPPVNGRVENILVKEGDNVRKGQVLAWMSSTERAALLDAAQAQGEKKVKYWEEAYKPIALLAPIDGEVIVATTQPGQTVASSDAVVVLSDHLIARAQVDETDIGRIKKGQKAIITLDAYPDTLIKAVVEHIYYESKTVNNVTIYEVDLKPDEVLPILRSGMNTTIDFIEKSKENTMLIPLETLHKDKDNSFVLLKGSVNNEPVKRVVVTGISDDKNIEILSGINADEKIIIKTKKFILPKADSGTNPFMPSRKKKEPTR